jgi:hypothetical protein
VSIRPWWFYGGAVAVIVGVVAIGFLVDRLRRTLGQLVEWAHGADEFLEEIRQDFFTPPAEPQTAESHALDIAGGLRMPVETGPATQASGQWREANIGGTKRRFYIGP